MTHDERKEEFEKLLTRAKRSGLLRVAYPAEGIAILQLPPAPPPDEPTAAPAATEGATS